MTKIIARVVLALALAIGTGAVAGASALLGAVGALDRLSPRRLNR